MSPTSPLRATLDRVTGTVMPAHARLVLLGLAVLATDLLPMTVLGLRAREGTFGALIAEENERCLIPPAPDLHACRAPYFLLRFESLSLVLAAVVALAVLYLLVSPRLKAIRMASLDPADPHLPLLQRLAHESGVRGVAFVTDESSRVDGHAFYLGRRPTVYVSLGLKGSPHLAATVRHELAHLNRRDPITLMLANAALFAFLCYLAVQLVVLLILHKGLPPWSVLTDYLSRLVTVLSLRASILHTREFLADAEAADRTDDHLAQQSAICFPTPPRWLPGSFGRLVAKSIHLLTHPRPSRRRELLGTRDGVLQFGALACFAIGATVALAYGSVVAAAEWVLGLGMVESSTFAAAPLALPAGVALAMGCRLVALRARAAIRWHGWLLGGALALGLFVGSFNLYADVGQARAWLLSTILILLPVGLLCRWLTSTFTRRHEGTDEPRAVRWLASVTAALGISIVIIVWDLTSRFRGALSTVLLRLFRAGQPWPAEVLAPSLTPEFARFIVVATVVLTVLQLCLAAPLMIQFLGRDRREVTPFLPAVAGAGGAAVFALALLWRISRYGAEATLATGWVLLVAAVTQALVVAVVALLRSRQALQHALVAALVCSTGSILSAVTVRVLEPCTADTCRQPWDPPVLLAVVGATLPVLALVGLPLQFGRRVLATAGGVPRHEPPSRRQIMDYHPAGSPPGPDNAPGRPVAAGGVTTLRSRLAQLPAVAKMGIAVGSFVTLGLAMVAIAATLGLATQSATPTPTPPAAEPVPGSPDPVPAETGPTQPDPSGPTAPDPQPAGGDPATLVGTWEAFNGAGSVAGGGSWTFDTTGSFTFTTAAGVDGSLAVGACSGSYDTRGATVSIQSSKCGSKTLAWRVDGATLTIDDRRYLNTRMAPNSQECLVGTWKLNGILETIDFSKIIPGAASAARLGNGSDNDGRGSLTFRSDGTGTQETDVVLRGSADNMSYAMQRRLQATFRYSARDAVLAYSNPSGTSTLNIVINEQRLPELKPPISYTPDQLECGVSRLTLTGPTWEHLLAPVGDVGDEPLRGNPGHIRSHGLPQDLNRVRRVEC